MGEIVGVVGSVAGMEEEELEFVVTVVPPCALLDLSNPY